MYKGFEIKKYPCIVCKQKIYVESSKRCKLCGNI